MQSEHSTTELHAQFDGFMMLLKVDIEINEGWILVRKCGGSVSTGFGFLDHIVRVDINGYLDY